jgi:tetratricopeptide (TPR) repeat protein
LITFNGKSFDIPLLKSRFTLARRAWPLDSVSHVDLLFPARRIWKRRLGDCRLGNLEKEILGDERLEDVAGNLIPQIYFNYTRSGNPAGIRKILEHNSRDIVTLARLTLRVSEILHGKEKTTLFPEELFSVGRYFNQLGEREAGMTWNQAALSFPLQMDLRLAAMKNLATSYKSIRHFPQAVELWNALIKESESFPEEAYESLSIHYEHRERNLAKALLLTEQAIPRVHRETSRIRWMRRRNRLLRKIQKKPGLSQSAASDPLY